LVGNAAATFHQKQAQNKAEDLKTNDDLTIPEVIILDRKQST